MPTSKILLVLLVILMLILVPAPPINPVISPVGLIEKKS